MKNDILHSGKLYKFQRQHIYQIHLHKINQIAKKPASTISLNNDKFLPTYPSSYKIEQELKVKEQNDRLVKKLNQISNRKKFEVLLSEEDFRKNINKYVELQKSYREKYRNLREKSLQEENQKIVQKLLDKRRNERSKEDFRRDDDDYFMLKKSRSKKKSPKRQETSMGSQEKSRLQRNKSLLEKPQNRKSKKQQTERRRNYSTLLPTIEKMETKKMGGETVDNSQLLGLLKKYDGKVEKQETEKEKESQLMKYLDNYEEIENEEIPIVKASEKVNRISEPQENQQLPSKEQPEPKNKQNPEYVPLSNDLMSQKIQQSGPQKISQSEPLKGQNAMDPTLKFEKIKKSKKKKREAIVNVKEQQDYEDQAFEAEAEA